MMFIVLVTWCRSLFHNRANKYHVWGRRRV